MKFLEPIIFKILLKCSNATFERVICIFSYAYALREIGINPAVTVKKVVVTGSKGDEVNFKLISDIDYNPNK